MYSQNKLSKKTQTESSVQECFRYKSCLHRLMVSIYPSKDNWDMFSCHCTKHDNSYPSKFPKE